MNLTFKTSKTKNHVIFKAPKNYKTGSLEAYCKNDIGDLIWCYFSSELGVFLKNLNSRVSERFLTIEGIEYLDIDYNIETSSYILLYKKEDSYYLRYLDNSDYLTIPLNLNTDKAFVHYSEFYSKTVVVFKDKSSSKLIEYNSKDSFTDPLELSESVYLKQDLVQVGLSEDTGVLSFDFVVSDNTLLWDLELYPKFKDMKYREYPINISEFNYTPKN